MYIRDKECTVRNSTSDFRKVFEGFTHIRHNSKYMCFKQLMKTCPAITYYHYRVCTIMITPDCTAVKSIGKIFAYTKIEVGR